MSNAKSRKKDLDKLHDTILMLNTVHTNLSTLETKFKVDLEDSKIMLEGFKRVLADHLEMLGKLVAQLEASQTHPVAQKPQASEDDGLNNGIVWITRGEKGFETAPIEEIIKAGFSDLVAATKERAETEKPWLPVGQYSYRYNKKYPDSLGRWPRKW